MALPKLETPIHTLEVPSTGQQLKFRPFLVKEQKMLLMMQESDDENEIIDTMSQLINSCTFGEIKAESQPMFDIEYIFLQLRSKSVGESVELNLICPDDGKTTVKRKINLDKIEVQVEDNHTNEINISDQIKIVFKYPTIKDMRGVVVGESDVNSTISVLTRCIHEIHFGDDIYNRVDITEKELTEFVESLSTDQFTKVIEFFDTMPKLRHIVKVTNPKTKVKSEILIEGLQSFLV